jgi:hypothetical protein
MMCVKVKAGRRSDGTTVVEELLVRHIQNRRYELRRSPGLMMGMAAGDVFDLTESGEVEVVSRGGNVCVWAYDRHHVLEIDRSFTRLVLDAGGHRDGMSRTLIVYTFPISLGFELIEKLMCELVAQHQGAEWYYGNVYDPRDGVTPLNWWLDTQGQAALVRSDSP